MKSSELTSANFLQPSSGVKYPASARRPRRRFIRSFIVFMLVAAIAAAAGTAYQLAAPRDDALATALRHLPVVREFSQWLNPGAVLSGTPETLNIVMAGISGVGNDGPLLTDTLMLVTLKPRQSTFGLVSIPRDLAVATPAGSFQKVNSVYALAESSEPGSGLQKLAETMGYITGAPIDHVVVINFKGFQQLIEAFGGVTVDIQNSFTDYTYPDGRGGVKTIRFDKGIQRLNGTQALEYARSRHGTNGEGSDFARAHRQQQIIVALANEALQLRTLTSPRRLSALANLIENYVNTDLTIGDGIALALNYQHANPSAAPRLVLNDSPNNYLGSATGPDGAFLLVPRGGSFSRIHEAVRNLFSAAAVQGVTVEVQNGTPVAGLAQTVADALHREQFTVIKFGNAASRAVQYTSIYDYTDGGQPLARQRLQELFPGAFLRTGLAASGTAADFLIIIGQNHADGV